MPYLSSPEKHALDDVRLLHAITGGRVAEGIRTALSSKIRLRCGSLSAMRVDGE
jgi:hypothetical protein